MSTVELVDKLVRELVASREMLPETVRMLDRFKRDARSGSLHPDDLNYLRALHAKVLREKPSPEPGPGDEPDELTAQEWKERAHKAMKRAKAAERELEECRGAEYFDRKFLEIKKRFAKRYHPNSRPSGSSIENLVRAEIFKEFWAEFEEVGGS